MVSCLMGDSTALASAIVRCCPKLKLNSGVTSSEQNEQSGYMQIFAGCMTGIRNPRAHDSDWEDTEDRALQLLMLANHLIERAQMAEITE